VGKPARYRAVLKAALKGAAGGNLMVVGSSRAGPRRATATSNSAWNQAGRGARRCGVSTRSRAGQRQALRRRRQLLLELRHVLWRATCCWTSFAGTCPGRHRCWLPAPFRLPAFHRRLKQAFRCARTSRSTSRYSRSAHVAASPPSTSGGRHRKLERGLRAAARDATAT